MFRRPTAVRTSPGIDRNPQNLGVPLGGFDVVRKHGRIRPGRKWWRAQGATVVAVAGVAAAVGGGVLSATQPPVQVGRQGSGNGIRVGDAVLLPAGPNVYGTPPDPVLIIVPQPNGTTTAAASGYVDGQRVTGNCLMHQLGNVINEACTFTIGAGMPVTAVDSLDVTGGGLWHRRYSDGTTVTIQVPPNGAVVPVPFPIGRT